MSRRFGEGEDEEMRAAQARHKANAEREHQADMRESERLWNVAERRRQGAHGPRGGVWVFKEIRNSAGVTQGWNAVLNGHLEGLLILHPSGDLHAIAGGDSSRGDASGQEILAAFLQQRAP